MSLRDRLFLILIYLLIIIGYFVFIFELIYGIIMTLVGISFLFGFMGDKNGK